MKPVDTRDNPLFLELVKECGFNPFDLAAEAGKEILLASEVTKKILRENVHHIPRSAD